MVEIIQEAGWPVFPMLACGISTVGVAVRYAITPDRRDLPLIVGLGALTLLLGLFGTVLGVQLSAEHITQLPAEERWIFLLGLREALHNLTIALGLASIAAVAAIIGARRA